MAEYNLGTARGVISIDGKPAVKGIGQAQAAQATFVGSLGKTSKIVGKTGKVIGGIGLAGVAAFGLAAKFASDFESRMNAIEAVSGATGKEMDKLRGLALKLGADTKFSAGEAAGAMEELLKAGLNTADVMNGAADATVNLAAAGEIDLKSAATIAANAMNGFNLAAKDMPHIADLIAGAANASAIDVGEFGQSMQQSAAVANLAGLSFDDLSVAIAAMGNAGIRGSDAGTSLKTMLQNLQPVTDKQKDLFKELGIITEDGSNAFYDAAGNTKSLADIAGVLQKATAGLTTKEKQMALEVMFGSDAIRAAAVIANEGSDGMNKLAGAIGKVSAKEVAETRMKGLGGALEELSGSAETLAIVVGTPLLKSLTGLANKLTSALNWFTQLPAPMRETITSALKIASVFLLVAGGALYVTSKLMKLFQFLMVLKKTVFVTKLLKGIAIGFRLIGAALIGNPIGIIVTALVALGIALYVLYKKSETFRKFVDKLWQGIQKAWDFILEAFKTGIRWLRRNWDIILAIFLGPIGIIILVVRRFGDDIVRIISGAINAVVNFFQALPGRVVGLITSLIDMVVGHLKRLPVYVGFMVGVLIGLILRLFVEWFKTWTQRIPKLIGLIVKLAVGVIKEIAGMVPKVIGFVLEMTKKMLSAIADFVPRALSAIGRFVGGVVSWVSGLPGKILRAIPQALSLLLNKGKDIITGLKRGAVGAATSLFDWVRGLPGTIIRNIPNPLDILFDIGSKIIDGLVAGAKRAWEGAKDFFGGIADGITSIKGPERKDKKLLTPHGQWIMESLMAGVQSRYGKLMDQFRSVASSISGSVNGELAVNASPALASAGTGGMTLNFNFNAPVSPGTATDIKNTILDPSVLKELTAAARGGRRP